MSSNSISAWEKPCVTTGGMARLLVFALLLSTGTEVALATNYVQTDGTNTTDGITITIASGDTLEISGKVTGTGRLTTSGSGTLILTNGENDWTGGIKVGKGGTLKVTTEGALGANEVILSEDVSGAAGATIIFAAPSATFANAVTVKRSSSIIRFAADTVLTGNVTVGNNDTYMRADSGVHAVVKGKVSTSSSRPLVFDSSKGSISLEGVVGGANLSVTEWQQNGSSNGGVVYLCNPGNTFNTLSIASIAYVCSNENVVAASATVTRNKYNGSAGRFDLNGFDQTIKGFSMASSSTTLSSSDTNAIVTSAEPATLTLKGNGAGTSMTCNFAIQGQVSLLIDSAAAATNRFLNRVNGTAGDITVRSGCLWLAGTGAAFTGVSTVTVEENGEFYCDSTAAKPLPNGIDLTLAEGSAFTLPPAVSITVSSFTVGGSRMPRGTYTSQNCDEIRSGTVVVETTSVKSPTWTGEGLDESASTPENWSVPDLDFGIDNLNATFASGGTRAVIDRDIYFTGLTMTATNFTFAPGGGRMVVLSNNLSFAVLDGSPLRTNVFAAPLSILGGLRLTPPANTVVQFTGDVAPEGDSGGTVYMDVRATGSKVLLSGTTINKDVKIYTRTIDSTRSSWGFSTAAGTTNVIGGKLIVEDATSQGFVLDSRSELVVNGLSAQNGCTIGGGGRLVITNSPLQCPSSKTVQLSMNADYGGKPELVLSATGNTGKLTCGGYGGVIDCRANEAFASGSTLSMSARWNGNSLLRLNSTTQSWSTVTILKEYAGPVAIQGGKGAKMRVTGTGESYIRASNGKVNVIGEVSLEKSGTGALTISNCTFDTAAEYSVSGGTLVLAQEMLDSESVLRLSGSGVISVADGVRQKFSAVYVDGNPVSSGTYSYQNAPAALKVHMADTTGRIRVAGGGFVITFR